jgi:hypothetical protein
MKIVGAMKSFSKIQFEDFHVNPVVRNLALVAFSGLMVAISIMMIIAMLLSKY